MDFPCGKRLHDLCGVDELEKYGMIVEIWNVTPILHKNIFNTISSVDFFPSNQCRPFDTKHELIQAISTIASDTIVYCHTGYRLETFFIFREMSRHKIRYCVPQMISFPIPPSPRQGLSFDYLISLFRRGSSIKIKHLLPELATKILFRYYRFFGVREADVALHTGEQSFDFVRDPVGENTRHIWAHALDYDFFLSQKDQPVCPDPALAVYIDEYFPLHPDLSYIDTPCPVSVDEYYLKLRHFFDYIEKTYNVRIVIAAHPKSDYENTDYFDGRLVIKGQTSQMVRKSAFVLTHMSTALNLAVLFRKPIIFMTMDKFEESSHGRLIIGPYISSIASALNTVPINIDRYYDADWTSVLRVDTDAYEKYENDFIKKTGSPKETFWKIFIDRLRELYSKS
jgi:hypothetical protein